LAVCLETVNDRIRAIFRATALLPTLARAFLFEDEAHSQRFVGVY